MKISPPLDQMTVREKLDLIEAIWVDLEKTPDDIPTPKWHLELLEERQRRIDEGKESFLTWEDAKAKLQEILESRWEGASSQNHL